MQHEPQELRLASTHAARTRRHEAVRQAQRIVDAAQHTRVDAGAEADEALDEAFAETFSEPALAASPEAIDGGLMQQIAEQLKQLDAQREQLTALLERVQR